MQNNYHEILDTIKHLANNSPNVIVIAVSKSRSVDQIKRAYMLGLRHFGESYVQEALPKQDQLRELPIIWHFIGPIQSNKIKNIAKNFTWVHSVDSMKIIEGLAKHYVGNEPLNLLLQINIDKSVTKRGIEPMEIIQYANYIKQYSNLKLRGFMIIPDPKNANYAFKKIKKLFDDSKNKLKLDHLSMGMSADYSDAVSSGATMIRIGSKLFDK